MGIPHQMCIDANIRFYTLGASRVVSCEVGHRPGVGWVSSIKYVRRRSKSGICKITKNEAITNFFCRGKISLKKLFQETVRFARGSFSKEITFKRDWNLTQVSSSGIQNKASTDVRYG